MGDNNLFNPEYTQGNLTTIQPLVKFLGWVTVVVLSAIGFGIVSSTLIVNSLFALYSVKPGFWLKVDAAHKASLDPRQQQGGNTIIKGMGWISVILLSFLPNIHALVEAQDGLMDVKSYWVKAMPAAILEIFIGVFVFYGYPAAVAEKFSNFGRGMIDLTLMNVNPMQWVQALPDKYLKVELSTDGSNADYDKAVNKITKEAYRAYVGYLTDMTKESRAAIARQLEVWVLDNTSNLVEEVDTKKYSMSAFASVSVSEPDVSRIDGQGVDGVKTFAFYAPLADWDNGSTMDQDDKYVKVQLTFSKKAEGTVNNNINCRLTTAKPTVNAGTGTLTIALPQSSTGMLKAGTSAIGFQDKYKVVITVNSESMTIKMASSADNAKISGTVALTGVAGLYYQETTNRHPIKEIMFGSTATSSTTFKALSGTGIADWKFGNGPILDSDTSTSTTTTTTTKNTSTSTSTSGGLE